MSSTSPSDLAVAFRSLPRRVREAQGEAPSEVVSEPLAALAAAHAAACRLVGITGDHQALAAAIESKRAEEWDEALLDELRRLALDAGHLVRDLARQAGTD